MSLIRSIVLSSLLVLIFSCRKDEEFPGVNVGLVGKWQQTELSGNGAVSWTKIPKFEAQYVEFHANGAFTETKSLISSSTPRFNAYKIIDSTNLEMIPINKSSKSVIWQYSELTPTTLTLHYDCQQNSCLSRRYVPVN